MAFGFSDIGSMFGKGMGQYGAGLDKMRAMPMDQKLMAAGQIAHGGVSPMDMMGAVNHLGQPPGSPGAPGVPGAPGMTPPPATPPAQAAQNDPSGMFGALLPMLLKNGGAGLLGGAGLGAMGGGGGGLGGLGGLLSGFGFGGH
jgi:hypothetical protein